MALQYWMSFESNFFWIDFQTSLFLMEIGGGAFLAIRVSSSSEELASESAKNFFLFFGAGEEDGEGLLVFRLLIFFRF